MTQTKPFTKRCEVSVLFDEDQFEEAVSLAIKTANELQRNVKFGTGTVNYDEKWVVVKPTDTVQTVLDRYNDLGNFDTT